jgi:hypothetical protein
LDIAERSGLPFSAISDAADLLSQNKLLESVPDATSEAGKHTGSAKVVV